MADRNTKVPKYGWKVKLDHVFPEKRTQNYTPPFRVVFSLITLIIRYLIYQVIMYIRGRKPVMDYIKVVNPKQMYGVPFGGIGGGTIGRGFKGEFCRFQIRPGIYEYETANGNQFILTVQDEHGVTVYQNVLSPSSGPEDGSLSCWKWKFPGKDASYTGLYPRSWTTYEIPECSLKLICRQISPVIPDNYKDSCLPGGVFIWDVINKSDKMKFVTITFTLEGYKDASSCELFEYAENKTTVYGMKIYSYVDDMKCTFAFGAKEKDDVILTRACFNPKGSGNTIWQQLHANGSLTKPTNSITSFYGTIGCAVSAQTKVQGNSSNNLEFSLVWDMPIIHFREKLNNYTRYYTKYFGNDGKASPAMCHYALSNYGAWEKSIEAWQDPILNNVSLPDWYKSALFNELYFVSDGGTVWTLMDDTSALSPNDVRREYGRFAYLEGHEYRMYNTYDVHFYASFALAHLWPKLQASIQYEFRDTVDLVDNRRRIYLYNGHIGPVKEANCIPHDIGDPEGECFKLINAYPVHNVTDWRDLNVKFVLQCYRDYVYNDDLDYLRDMWPKITTLMQVCLRWDTAHDGMIENGGFPDQTYDCWTMAGVSSYCGGLWLGALYSTVKMAIALNEPQVADNYAKILESAKKVYDTKLWNDDRGYYIFDTSGDSHSQSIMADQLCGLWYLSACYVDDQILPNEKVKRALTTIYYNNVCKFANGQSGAVNGMTLDGTPDPFTVQSLEVWTGVTYALASHMVFHGMIEQGLSTAKGIYETVYNRIGMAYETPEALYENHYFRSAGYMRPLSIWSIQLALQHTSRRAIMSNSHS